MIGDELVDAFSLCDVIESYSLTGLMWSSQDHICGFKVPFMALNHSYTIGVDSMKGRDGSFPAQLGLLMLLPIAEEGVEGLWWIGSWGGIRS